MRRRIIAVEVVDRHTHRTFFRMDAAELDALREAPPQPARRWSLPDRLTTDTDWPVVFLVYFDHGAPYLGHPRTNALYFFEDDDPWTFAWETESGAPRKVSSMALGDRLYRELEDELGRPDPTATLAPLTRLFDEFRCHGQTPPTERPPTFPHHRAPPPPTARTTMRSPKLCPHAFEPSLAALDPPPIHPHNSAKRLQRLRGRIEGIEVIEASTHRVLYVVDEATVATVRKTPPDPPVSWAPNERTASLPAWPVALLVHVSGEPHPFLAWLFDDAQLYLVDEPDPWNTAVFEPDMRMREVFAIPTNAELVDFLHDRFGPMDPFDKVANDARRTEDARCGRVSRPHGEPFPWLPKALVEPAEPPP